MDLRAVSGRAYSTQRPDWYLAWRCSRCLSSSLFLEPDAEEAKARGKILRSTPGPSVRCVREAAPRLFYARAARHCPVLQRDGIAVRERTFRGYYCRRCGVAVCICSECDVGHIYCNGTCAQEQRRFSVRAAGDR